MMLDKVPTETHETGRAPEFTQPDSVTVLPFSRGRIFFAV